jgi:DNA-binding NarL/FixJ family response regulator
MMDDFANPEECPEGLRRSPVLVIIERHMLTRTCILSILKRELSGFEIIEMATMSDLNRASGRDIRLVGLSIGDKSIADPSIEDDLAVLAESFPHAPVALLSNRDDEATASSAMRRGVRGFFPTSIPVEVAIAGLRLVLAGGVYRPLPIDASHNGIPRFETMTTHAGSPEPSRVCEAMGAAKDETHETKVDLTPREKHVLAALKLGLPNKLIAARLNLSENTVKMHIQHILRKCSARNRTEAVLLWSGQLLTHNGRAGS